MNIKYEHVAVAFGLFLVLSGLWFWVDKFANQSIWQYHFDCDDRFTGAGYTCRDNDSQFIFLKEEL